MHEDFQLLVAVQKAVTLETTPSLIIADKLGHLCGLLSQSLRINEPPFAEWRANNTINKVTSCII
ncbi:hypothetical protein GCM10011351_20570 [Paraliobacillus quinghaiensis]|uniref:Uncharacterized protein n=1 Tax=Paraliobacillus quinghaiensis TaxID=470815 RepID=A0A917WW74_9BACI|nr:hypothetical protein GCM10011351_20570 [Paraliobacillus quinghaiensis]